ncbi:DUF4190 domain-containing protein [Nocardioides caldifontis]|uniref:DUF4190 domain-containing protein n=1 Tax=Nocardioides caldifontis TaxID=2588938 RepID=UPI0011DF396F|nr:DUF4190 domain-containing protein [Nocardioides caldifontis]
MSYPPPPPGPDEPQGGSTPPPGQWGPPSYPPAPGQPGQPPYGGYPPAPPVYTPPPSPPSSGRATTSLVLGIASLVLCGLFTGIPAIILGIKARREIRESDGRVGGDGLALGGIITGVIGTLVWLVVYFFVIAVVWLGAEWFDAVRDDICDDVDIAEVDDPNYELCY